MARRNGEQTLDDDPLWYKDAIIYELHVRAFADSDGDGIGDFRGLTEKLDYLQDLGVTAIWLLPFYPSPLKDDGYDIADYGGVHPAYGTVRDVQRFVREAHKRGLRVITELVVNHTSDQHAWFQRARRAPAGSKQRDYYVWSDTPERYQGARLIFPDYESSNWAWDPVAQAYYWHRFYTQQPDLNFESLEVKRAITQVLDYWMGMGVDGFRLDAVPYLYEREGTSCENLTETHAYLKELRAHVNRRFKNRMLLAEANQWPEDAVAYFGEGDECHMAFHFPVMPRLFMAIRMEDRYPIIEIMEETPDIPESCQWALFLRNHDELTLEMVTDEDRDYMYRAYAQDAQARVNLGIRRRLAPLLGNARRRIELMNGLLFSLPGTPVIYYGDEIGMGDNIYQGDRNAVRTPMQWSADRNAGFSRANPQQLFLPVIIDPEYHYETVNVEAQQGNPHSLLWWMKRLIALRKRHKAFGRGTLEFLQPENRKVLAFIRRYENQRILVVANLSRFVQAAELDLSELEGHVPVEMFGHTEFPPIGQLPYFVTLGPHAFYWFLLEPQPAEQAAPTTEKELPRIGVRGTWESVFTGRGRAELESALPAYVRWSRWFAGKARRLRGVQFVDTIPVRDPGRPPAAYITLLRVDYAQGEPETYALPLAFASGERADELFERSPHAAVARVEVQGKGESGVLFDALWEDGFCRTLLGAFGRRRFAGESGELTASTTSAYRSLRGPAKDTLDATTLNVEQSNTSVVYGDRLILKVFRRPEPGVNPDLEIGRYLTEQARFPHTAHVAGAIEYRRGRSEPLAVGLLHGLVANEGDAWSYTLDALGSYLESVRAKQAEAEEPVRPKIPRASLLRLSERGVPAEHAELIGPFVELASLLGRRTAELHLALAQNTDDKAFAPESMTDFYRRSLYQSMRTQATQNLNLLQKQRRGMADADRRAAKAVLDRRTAIDRRFRAVADLPMSAMRIRVHGDYHLGQVLFTGKDFVIIDFEGEPARPLSERRLKRSPLRDVAGMLRSFHYASHAALRGQVDAGLVDVEGLAALEPWAQSWYLWVGAAFLREYLATADGAAFLPDARDELQALLDAFLLDKAIYEVGYELNNRPAWVRIPLQGVLQLLDRAR